MDAECPKRLPVPGAANPLAERRLEQWLSRSLAHAHDKVLTEGIPQAWLALIDSKLPDR